MREVNKPMMMVITDRSINNEALRDARRALNTLSSCGEGAVLSLGVASLFWGDWLFCIIRFFFVVGAYYPLSVISFWTDWGLVCLISVLAIGLVAVLLDFWFALADNRVAKDDSACGRAFYVVCASVIVTNGCLLGLCLDSRGFLSTVYTRCLECYIIDKNRFPIGVGLSANTV